MEFANASLTRGLARLLPHACGVRSCRVESGRGALDLLGVPGLLDGLRSVLEERGLLEDGAPSLERLREALAGRYRFVGELGRGGNAVVYLAYETALQRPAALEQRTSYPNR